LTLSLSLLPKVRDEYRTDFDPGRGGYGKQKQLELEAMEKRRIAVTYLENLSEIPVGGDFSKCFPFLHSFLFSSQLLRCFVLRCYA
jgi:hypothetical protein